MLVTGPTGSGKSTTLYAALSAVDDRTRKILTVEDPVEHRLPGIMQVQVQAEIGYTFARALRSFLRHDPDIIMVGEIRDRETAEIAIQSALTGHLVLATLHTNDALSAFTRLIDMGIEPYLVAAAVQAVMAQRLVRRLCPQCAAPAEPPPGADAELARWPAAEPVRWLAAVGCERCQRTGYRGRLGIYELVDVDAATAPCGGHDGGAGRAGTPGRRGRPTQPAAGRACSRRGAATPPWPRWRVWRAAPPRRRPDDTAPPALDPARTAIAAHARMSSQAPIRFRYRALDRQGQRLAGDLVADSPQAALLQLQQRQLSVLDLVGDTPAAPAPGAGPRLARRRIGASDRIVLLQEFATLLTAGVPIAEATPSLEVGLCRHGPGRCRWPACARPCRTGARWPMPFAWPIWACPSMRTA